MSVKREKLFLISAIVWLVAGGNVFRIGLISYENEVTLLHLVVSLVVFISFWWLVFKKMTLKHIKRINSYSKITSFFNFFDKKSYIMMFFMITLGIIMRFFMPLKCVAMFYSGLGVALFLSGVMLFKNYMTTTK